MEGQALLHTSTWLPHVGEYNLQRKKFHDETKWKSMVEDLRTSSTLYVGNLSFSTTEESVMEFFSKGGNVRRVIIGLNNITKTPCGFCFVEYETHDEAIRAMNYFTGAKLDDRIIRVEIDGGFTEGRQFGRGTTGGQVRDIYRTDFDAGRGGWGPSIEENKKKKSMYDTNTKPTPNKRKLDETTETKEEGKPEGGGKRKRGSETSDAEQEGVILDSKRNKAS